MTNSTNFNSEYFLGVITRLEEINGRLLELKKVWMPEKDRKLLERLIKTSDPFYLKSVPYKLFDFNNYQFDEVGSYIKISIGSAFSEDFNNPAPAYNLKKQLDAFKKLLSQAKKIKLDSEKIKTLELKDLGIDLHKVWKQFIFDYWKTCCIPNDLDIQINLDNEDHKEWESWEKLYFYSRAKRAEFADNLSKAIEENNLSNELAKNNDEVLDELDEVKISSDKKGFVYFIRNQDIYKIGITQNLLRRLDQLNPDEVLNTVRCSNFDQLEKDLHKLFKENRIPQTEYFRLTPSQVEEVHQLMTTKAKF